MTADQLLHYIEVGVAFAVIVAPTVGAIGHALAALPWAWAKTLGNVLNAISVDFGDLKNSRKNAKASVVDPTGGTTALAKAIAVGAVQPLGGDLFQAPPGSVERIASVAPPPPDPPTPRDRPLPPAAIALLFAGSLALNQTACAGEQARPTLAELEKACPSAARVMTIDCPALALRMCPDAPTLDECDARVALEDECDRLIQKELDRCP
jgi:hypothetical protein